MSCPVKYEDTLQEIGHVLKIPQNPEIQVKNTFHCIYFLMCASGL